MGSTLLFVVNVDWFFISHRLPIARAAARAGHVVHIACGVTGREQDLRAEGFIVHPIRLDRGTTGIAAQLKAFADIVRVIRTIRPAIVHLVTIKPVLLGGIAARLLRVPRVVAAISGLGFVFIADGFVARLRRFAVGLLYRSALGSPRVRVIFQNGDDRRLISHIAGIDDGQVTMIRGSGVDLDIFCERPLPQAPFTAVFAARLLIDKGVREFVEAARRVRAIAPDARFMIAGDVDPHNPACVPSAEIARWRAEGAVEFLGHVADMAGLWARAHVAVLPSYREGMPLVLLEAAACGRAVVTTDVPGCREAIEPDVTGLLVPVRSGERLADALLKLIDDPARCAAFGREARKLAERAFSIRNVVDRHLALYAGQPA